MSPASIELDPDPPVGGKDCTISYTGTKPVTIRYKIDPPGTDWVEVTLTANDPTSTFAVPANAAAIQLEDMSGHAPYRDVPVG